MSLRRNQGCAALLALIIGCFATHAAQADTKYWNGTALGTGVGTGWDATSAWSTDPNNPTPNPATIPGASDVATFNISSVNSDQVVNLYGNQSVQGLSFISSGALTLQGGDANHTLTLGSGGITTGSTAGETSVGSNVDGQRLNMVLAGSQTWNSSGTGILAVGGGTTTTKIAPVAGGGNMTLTLGGTNNAISTVTTTSPSHNNFSNIVFSQLTDGPNGEVLSVVKNGPGYWVLNANNNTFSGGVTVNDGVLAVAVNSGVSNSFGTGTLTLNGGELRGTGAFGFANGGFTNSINVTANSSLASIRVRPDLNSNMVFTSVFTSPGTQGNGPVLTLKQSLYATASSLSFKQGTSFSGFNGTLRFLQDPSGVADGGSIIQFAGTGAVNDLSHAKVLFESTTGSPVGIPFNQAPRIGGADNDKIQFGELSGNGVIGGLGNVNYTIEVGALNTNSVFSGDITQHFRPSTTESGVQSAQNFRKVGTGSLTMSGDNSYIGDTTIANGTLVAGTDALVSKANISKLATGFLSVTGNTFDNNFSGLGPHGLSNGDRVFIENITINNAGDNTSHLYQPYYVINSTSSSFQLSLTPNGSPESFVDDLGGIGISMPTAFGAGTTPIALGDGTGGAVALLAGTASRPTVTIARAVAVAAGGGTPTFGSTVNGNSVFSGPIALGKDVNITSASTSGNALTVSGAISGTFGIDKVGTGKAILSGTNTYTGNTKVDAGILSLTSPFLADASNVQIASGSILDLNYSGADTITSLYLNGIAQSPGLYGASALGASFFTGSGLLNVLTLGPPIGPLPGDFNSDGHVNGLDFNIWQSSFPTTAGANLAGGDADGDGDVDGADFIVWQTHYAPGGGATPVPEPAAIFLLAAASVFGLPWLRRAGNAKQA